jgi:hypothetical protein
MAAKQLNRRTPFMTRFSPAGHPADRPLFVLAAAIPSAKQSLSKDECNRDARRCVASPQ